MINIIKNKYGYLNEIVEKFKVLGKTITFTDEFIEKIANKALENSDLLGARELFYLINEELEDIMFNIDDDKLEYIV